MVELLVAARLRPPVVVALLPLGAKRRRPKAQQQRDGERRGEGEAERQAQEQSRQVSVQSKDRVTHCMLLEFEKKTWCLYIGDQQHMIDKFPDWTRDTIKSEFVNRIIVESFKTMQK